MSSKLPLVSFIAINYNTLADTLEFLESAKKITYKNVEIILVDNASKENPEKQVRDLHPDITFIRSEKNLGFAGGNNLGIKAASGDYLFFLNNDTILFPDFLEPIVDFMETHPEVGMASPKVLYPDGETIQYAGAIRVSPYTGRGKRLGLFEKDHGQYDTCYPTDLGHGAALIVPRKVVNKIGGMPELFFLYYEEHDWCEQMKRAGFSMYYLGNSKILHKESVSTGGEESPLKVYYLTRNRILFMRRNFNGILFVPGILFFGIVSTPKSLLKYLIKRKPELIKAFVKGVWWNVTNRKIA
jgi:GT2 family glycosyltransferase